MAKAIALSAGEPAGVGLELTLAAWKQLRFDQPFYLIADRDHVKSIAGSVPIEEIEDPEQAARAMKNALPLLHLTFPEVVEPAIPSICNAAAVINSIKLAVQHVQNGAAAALCTNPISKDIVRRGAEFPFPGQTEFLAHLAGTKFAVMMLVSRILRVVPATTHIALSEVSGSLSRSLLKRTIETTRSALIDRFKIPNPRIAVSGLNPHAGESGLFGNEENGIIRPVIAELVAREFLIEGPLSADTMFHPEARARFDAAVCMFHDQALIPFKTLSFYEGVNVTLGLPFIRTSPDHGPALDIAGRQLAKPDSLVAAIRLAARLSNRGMTAE